MIYELGHRISFLLNIQGEEKTLISGLVAPEVLSCSCSPPSWTKSLIDDSVAGWTELAAPKYGETYFGSDIAYRFRVAFITFAVDFWRKSGCDIRVWWSSSTSAGKYERVESALINNDSSRLIFELLLCFVKLVWFSDFFWAWFV